MQKFKLYKIWLALSVAVVVVAICLTLLFAVTLPKDCPSCGMGALGLVPVWLLSVVAIIANVVAIPDWLGRHRDATPALRRTSWSIFGIFAAIVSLQAAYVVIRIIRGDY